MKVCRLCKQELPLDAFSGSPGMRDGLRSECRACHSARGRAWNAANRERRAKYDADRYDRVRSTAQKRAWKSKPENRARFNETHSRWQQANIDRKLEWNRRWRKNNPDAAHALSVRARVVRASAPGLVPSPAAVAALVAYWGHQCWMCSGPFEELDHVKPVAAGGAHWPANLRPACKRCNRLKSSKWFGVNGLEALRQAVVARSRGVVVDTSGQPGPTTTAASTATPP